MYGKLPNEVMRDRENNVSDEVAEIDADDFEEPSEPRSSRKKARNESKVEEIDVDEFVGDMPSGMGSIDEYQY